MHDPIKTAVGIECANCASCRHLSSDNDGGEPEYSVSWHVCSKFDRYHHLTSFPFEKEMACWEPDFWHSKFPDEIKTCSNREMDRLVKKFWAAVEAATPAPATATA